MNRFLSSKLPVISHLLPGATIPVKDHDAAAGTDTNGRCSLTLPASAKTPVVFRIGMEPQEIPIGTKITFDITMHLQSLAEQPVGNRLRSCGTSCNNNSFIYIDDLGSL